MTYDGWKTRSDLDDNPPEYGPEDEHYECPTCDGPDGSHALGCPDSPGFGDHIDAEIDRLQEMEP